MRLSRSISLIICSVAVYFTLHWGLDAIRILMPPLHGLDDRDFARIVTAIARLCSLPPVAVAAFFGVLKLSVALLFALYLGHRVRHPSSEPSQHEILETGLALVTFTIFAMALPVFTHDPGHAFDQYRVAMWMAGLAATLTMVERACTSRREVSRSALADIEARQVPVAVGLPRRRGRVSAMRWNLLRQDARLADR